MGFFGVSFFSLFLREKEKRENGKRKKKLDGQKRNKKTHSFLPSLGLFSSRLSLSRSLSLSLKQVHVITEKGRGYAPAEAASDKMHGVGKYDPRTGVQVKAGKTKAGSYTNYFADALVAEAELDSRVIGIHAAMGGGTGLNRFEKRFPDRTFDVGIAEQHAVTFAAGLATEGLVPFCAIYSSFLQRGYDQVVHDVSLQSLPVRFALDRAGLVGADGATHCGSFDTAYLG